MQCVDFLTQSHETLLFWFVWKTNKLTWMIHWDLNLTQVFFIKALKWRTHKLHKLGFSFFLHDSSLSQNSNFCIPIVTCLANCALNHTLQLYKIEHTFPNKCIHVCINWDCVDWRILCVFQKLIVLITFSVILNFLFTFFSCTFLFCILLVLILVICAKLFC